MNSAYLDPIIAEQLLAYLADENTVVVGGQSVMAWAQYFGIINKHTSYTRDIDIFGTYADIEAADLRLIMVEHETKFAEPNDSSPNSGLILITLPGSKKVRVDFLWAVQGLSGSDIQERSVKLKLGETDKFIRVLHPLMCLESKIVNLGAFPIKRDEAGVAQAKMAIKVAHAYISDLLAHNRERDALNAVERVFRVAQLDAASFIWHIFDIDLVEAIPVAALPQAFQDIRLPQMADRLNTVRIAFGRRLPEDPVEKNTRTMRF